MTFPTRLTAILLLAAQAAWFPGAAVHAQEVQPSQDGGEPLRSLNRQLDDANDARRLQMEYYFATSTAALKRTGVKPYSGQEVVDVKRPLHDGNEISTHEVLMRYRDSSGRTRYDVSRGQERKATIIIDPARQVAYMIRPDRADILRVSGPATRAQLTSTVPVAPESPYKRQVSTQLGVKEMAGVPVSGLLWESTVPAGEKGNTQEIHVTHETWRSRELGISIYSRQSDPRWGERTVYYENLTLAEPAEEVFALPDGYTVRDIATVQASR